MLATLGTTADVVGQPAADGAAEDWAFEMKWDGIRAIAYVEASGDVRLFSRNGNDVSRTYPDLFDPLRQAVGVDAAVLDGEIVAVNKTGRPDFGLLQTRMKLTKKADVDAGRPEDSGAVHALRRAGAGRRIAAARQLRRAQTARWQELDH